MTYTVLGGMLNPTHSLTLLHLCVGWCSSLFQGPEPAVSHSSVTWTVGQTSPIYCR